MTYLRVPIDKKIKEVEQFIEIIKKKNVSPNIFTHNFHINGYCVKSNIVEERAAFNFIKDINLIAPYYVVIKPIVVTYGTIIYGLVRKGRFNGGQGIFYSMETDFHNEIRAHSSSKLDISILPFSFLCSTFHVIPHKDKFFFILRYHKKVDNAISLFDEVVRMQPLPKAVSFNKFFTTIVKMEGYVVTLSLFHRMCILDIRLNEYSLTVVIHCHYLMYRWDLGFSILGYFVKFGYEPNVTISRTLLKGLKMFEPDKVMILMTIDDLCTTGHILRARDLLAEKIKKVVQVIKIMKKKNFHPNIFTYNFLIDRYCIKSNIVEFISLCKHGMFNNALQLCCKMIEDALSPKEVPYTIIIQSFCNSIRWMDVKEILAKMTYLRMLLDVFTFSVLVNCFCKQKKMKKAGQVVEIMKKKNIPLNIFTYNYLIHRYCIEGNIIEAIAVFNSLEGMNLTSYITSYNSLIHGYCKKCMLGEAWILFHDFVVKNLWYGFSEYLHSIHTVSSSILIYGTIIYVLVHEGRLKEGWNIFNSLKTDGKIAPNLQIYNAFSFLPVMKAKGHIPDIMTFTILIYGLYKNKDLEFARNIFNSLTWKGLHPRTITYNPIFLSLCEKGYLVEVTDLVTELINRDRHPHTALLLKL
ncbi:hypothetical protein CDL12_26390 [Handroanthus impetiginosus]|uniref:Pentacotripeptide-repeat region of PRORP domain-containing protein n=1 Tax=Handroanthus impetiginosus TaxID=429701 RepID=A0A2G9G728_9LAMI|nr:hypothetical protein CDL12_26390 [Handroanthus impetiginosus]